MGCYRKGELQRMCLPGHLVWLMLMGTANLPSPSHQVTESTSASKKHIMAFLFILLYISYDKLLKIWVRCRVLVSCNIGIKKKTEHLNVLGYCLLCMCELKDTVDPYLKHRVVMIFNSHMI